MLDKLYEISAKLNKNLAHAEIIMCTTLDLYP